MRGRGVKYEEEARQKVALGGLLPMGLTRLNLLLHPIIPAGGGLLVTMNTNPVLMSMTMVVMNMPGHGSGWS